MPMGYTDQGYELKLRLRRCSPGHRASWYVAFAQGQPSGPRFIDPQTKKTPNASGIVLPGAAFASLFSDSCCRGDIFRRD
ncbi:hypothetical protein PS928_06616 [Pseudomonas fluorescens]|uniref:Uncharacterized protein n=1 Tax=Pseudomonas fluorescens TaxID=294 RepID=A0A5E7VUU9_PSEFL|nr:hypothetical protein PS928_06616 [Pseudomonas fluorescens]